MQILPKNGFITRLAATAGAFGALMLPVWGQAPNLEMPGADAGMTPVWALQAGNLSQPAVEKLSPMRVEDDSPSIRESSNIPAENHKASGIQPAVLNASKAIVRGIRQKINPDALQDVAYYSPLSAIAVLPVMSHGREKAFGDLPLVMADELANALESRAKGTRILNPAYTVEELRIRGLGGVYQQVMDYYQKAGRPEPKALQYLLKELSADGEAIHRVVFVEAVLDLSNPAAPTGWGERFKAWTTDGLPMTLHYRVTSRVQVFDASDERLPRLWTGESNRPVDGDASFNVTPSILQDSDSHHWFVRVSRSLSADLLRRAPKVVYLQPHFATTAVAGQLTLPDTENPPDGGLDTSTVERILNRP